MTVIAAKVIQSNIDYLASKWLFAITKPNLDDERIGHKEVHQVITQVLKGLSLVLDDKDKTYLFESKGVVYKKAKFLGEIRRAQGYQLEQVITEYLELRKALWRVLRDKLRTTNIDVFELEERINFCLMNVLRATIESFHHRQTKDLQEQAVTDALTGLFNRRQFDKIIEHEVYRSIRYERPLSLVILDIDHFKMFNDTYGHTAGDMALEQISEVIRQFLRTSDAAARYGGEEFALVLPETSEEQAYQVSSRIRRAVERFQFKIKNKKPTCQLTVSIGIACYPHDATTQKALIEAADTAMYKAKNSGRNRVICFSNANKSVTKWFSSNIKR